MRPQEGTRASWEESGGRYNRAGSYELKSRNSPTKGVTRTPDMDTGRGRPVDTTNLCFRRDDGALLWKRGLFTRMVSLVVFWSLLKWRKSFQRKSVYHDL